MMLPNVVALNLVFGTALVVVAQNSGRPFPVVGVQSSRSVRRNVNDLFDERGPEWDLYVQALSAMQDADSDDPLSWFQIGAIHGQPRIEWNNTGRGIPGNDAGYCTHSFSRC
ncbi:hypothetical protein CDD83_6105 [Cordyceps sp. RAO-2017]|nr:hypothetical protein CDD83_6105 [Cordyceps sp. RAO-2017]